MQVATKVSSSDAFGLLHLENKRDAARSCCSCFMTSKKLTGSLEIIINAYEIDLNKIQFYEFFKIEF